MEGGSRRSCDSADPYAETGVAELHVVVIGEGVLPGDLLSVDEGTVGAPEIFDHNGTGGDMQHRVPAGNLGSLYVDRALGQPAHVVVSETDREAFGLSLERDAT